MKNYRFLIILSGDFGEVQYYMHDYDSESVHCGDYAINKEYLFSGLIPDKIRIYELMDDSYIFVTGVDFVDCNSSCFKYVEDIIKAVVWNYSENRCASLSAKEIRALVEDYRVLFCSNFAD